MSNWGKVESKYGREVSGLKRLVKPYDYGQKDANLTDKNLRELLTSELRQVKTTLSDLLSLAYSETDEAATSFKRIMNDIDLAISEVKTLSYCKFPDDQQPLEKIFKADVVLLNNIELMKRTLNGIHTQILSSQAVTSATNSKLE